MRFFLVNVLAVPSFLSGLAAADIGESWAVGETVKTTSGNIEGHASSWKSEVSEYLGIPFAAPPVGGSRFAAPQPYNGEGKTLVAAKYGASCPANGRPIDSVKSKDNSAGGILAVLSQGGDVFGEDCLTLNVWSKPQSGEKAKAVMVWIHGGEFVSGTSGSALYNGARLAQENDVIVVTINYRLNIFGFPGVSVVPDKNPGLLDQRLAIEWVRDNIAGFGGDPKRIVLFGQAAGGASADYYSLAYTKDPIVTGFITESGNANLAGAKNNTDAWFRVSEKLGCGGASAAASNLDCMRSKSMEQILGVGGIGDFAPVADGQTVFSDWKERRASGSYIRKPLLVGSNENEAGLFRAVASLTGAAEGSSNSTGNRNGITSQSMRYRLMNLQFTCPAAHSAKARSEGGVPTWRYRYVGEWPNQYLGPNAGAWHGSEISLVFGTAELVSKQPDIAAQKELGDKVRAAWTSFAKDPEHGLEKSGWPLYNATLPTLVLLGKANSSNVEFVNPGRFDTNCRFYDTLRDTGMLSGLVSGSGWANGTVSAGKGSGNGTRWSGVFSFGKNGTGAANLTFPNWAKGNGTSPWGKFSAYNATRRTNATRPSGLPQTPNQGSTLLY